MLDSTPTLRAARTYAQAYGSMVRLSHTVFGLPFALTAAMLAHHEARLANDAGLNPTKLVLIVLAFTAARTAAMGFNRIVDRQIDAENPRTRNRELPAGVISVRAAHAFTWIAAAAFVATSWLLSPLAGLLAVPCLAIVLSYSYFKRFSWTSHLFLGLALALAPGGAWVAVLGDLRQATIPLLLMGAVATWVAGFDVLYSLQDEAFDRARGLHSIPARFGTRGALWLSGGLHLLTLTALLALHVVAQREVMHLIGVMIMGALLAYEHYLVRPNDLSRLDKAFFDLNGYAGLAYLLCAAIDIFGRS